MRRSGRRGVEQQLERLAKAHVEHLVRFIEHQHLDAAEIEALALHEIDQAAGRAHHHVDAALERAPVEAEIGATGERHHARAGGLEQPGELTLHLRRQLARGRDHQRARAGRGRQPLGVAEQPARDQQPEGDRLARPRLRRDQQIVIRRRQHRRLHGSGGVVASGIERTNQGWMGAERLELGGGRHGDVIPRRRRAKLRRKSTGRRSMNRPSSPWWPAVKLAIEMHGPEKRRCPNGNHDLRRRRQGRHSGQGSRFGTDGGKRYVARQRQRSLEEMVTAAAAGGGYLLLFGLFRGLRRNHEYSPSDSNRSNIEHRAPWQMPESLTNRDHGERQTQSERLSGAEGDRTSLPPQCHCKALSQMSYCPDLVRRI